MGSLVLKKMLENVRREFFKYYGKNGFRQGERVSLNSYCDYWNISLVNSALARFTPVLQGWEKLTSPVFLAQPCIKGVSDLVGSHEGYLTYFEQLGTGSQSHSKSETIRLLWSFLSQNLSFTRDKFFVTVCVGDQETIDAWKNLEFKDESILPSADSNCLRICDGQVEGLVTALIFDKGASRQLDQFGQENVHECGLDCRCGRFCEIGDIIFFSTQKGVSMSNVGLGLERLAMIHSDKPSVFEVGELGRVREIVKTGIGSEVLAEQEVEIRRIADHLRSAIFAISDGIYPGNKGSGYVIRRIIRRMAVAEMSLGQEGKLIERKVLEVITVMGEQHVSVQNQAEKIKGIILEEERKFLGALLRGRKFFFRTYQAGDILGEEESFRLYDTHGLPIEVIRKLAADYQVKVDVEGLMRRIGK